MTGLPFSIYIGFDPREATAFALCRHSIRRKLTAPVPIYGVVLDDLRAKGMFTRPMEMRDGQLWDVISEAPCATEFSNSRFLVPELARQNRKEGEPAGWALFMDCDMLVQENLVRLFEQLDPRYAVYCVKHRHDPPAGKKMDSQEQTRYARKNWSSFCVWNVDAAANAPLTVEMVNTVPGRDLHRFSWLADEQIGELSPEWNWLVGHNRPKVIHFTEGLPNLPGYENCEYSEEWRQELQTWALKG